jgi:hypothetical protein
MGRESNGDMLEVAASSDRRIVVRSDSSDGWVAGPVDGAAAYRGSAREQARKIGVIGRTTGC